MAVDPYDNIGIQMKQEELTNTLYRLVRYERVYLSLCDVAYTPFHIQWFYDSQILTHKF